MKERPIIMTAESVRAILAGRKTQTRRVVRPQPTYGAVRHAGTWMYALPDGASPAGPLRNPYGEAGDRLWVRETWMCDEYGRRHRSAGMVRYRADAESMGAWRSPRFMPRWASRIALRVTGVRVERLWDITEADALAEGVEPDPLGRWYGSGYNTAVYAYEAEWDRINGKRAPWASNCWVWAIEFTKEAPDGP